MSSFLDEIRAHFSIKRNAFRKALGWSSQRYYEHVKDCSTYPPEDYIKLIEVLKSFGVKEDEFWDFHRAFFS